MLFKNVKEITWNSSLHWNILYNYIYTGTCNYIYWIPEETSFYILLF